ncbi:hypothetical protein C8R44DRAFT_761227 [Mycena epipterygia]|nr:hypothetical protein C8R44DRAFT_761227 [Mycena epipterygia]
MHRSLRVPEVVAMICREVVSTVERDLNFHTTSTLATLSALARTCKAFSIPALDLL